MSTPVIEAAEAIIPHLPDLLGDEAKVVSEKLQILLSNKADIGKTEREIIELFNGHENVHAWMIKQLDEAQRTTRGGGSLDFSKLAGDPGDVKGEKYYKCRNSDCDYFDVKSADWEQIPRKCPKCGSAVIEDR